MNSAFFLETIWQDMLYALRTMRKNQTFTAATVLTLALGIGATTAIFTVVYAVLLKPLGYHDPDRLVLISGGATAARFEVIGKGQSYTEAGAFTVFTENVTLGGVDGPEPLKGARVSSNFLGILGVAPLAGRSFLPAKVRLRSAGRRCDGAFGRNSIHDHRRSTGALSVSVSGCRRVEAMAAAHGADASRG